jgi:hypothetical protein
LFIARRGIASSQVTGPVPGNGENLSSEAKAQKRPNAAQPVFELPHVRLPFDYRCLNGEEGTKRDQNDICLPEMWHSCDDLNLSS